MKSILVIGLGRYGKHLATMLTEQGNEVTVVDTDEELVNKIAPLVTHALIGNCMDLDVQRSLGIPNFDICFVCISNNFQSSIEITALLKELGAKYVISKTNRDTHTGFLRQLGADEVVYIERDMAQRTAVKFSARNAFDYIELTPEYAISEILVPESWVGMRIKALDLRTKRKINIIGIRNGETVIPVTDPNYILSSDEHLIVAGSKKDMMGIMDQS